jgi:hypothetical protein
MILKLLEEKQLHAKCFKCSLRVHEVEYFGHIISHGGVKEDSNKIKAMMECPIPKTLKNLRGFLGLTSKFVKNYGQIVGPLKMLLKNEALSWTQEATKAFETLKEPMCTTPVLSMFDFTKSFIVKCDASRHDIGAILIQEGRPLPLKATNLKERTYLNPFMKRKCWPYCTQLRNGTPT